MKKMDVFKWRDFGGGALGYVGGTHFCTVRMCGDGKWNVIAFANTEYPCNSKERAVEKANELLVEFAKIARKIVKSDRK